MKYLLILLTYYYLFSASLYSQETINQLDNQGRKTGYWRVLYDNGKIRYEGSFIDDKPVGEFKRYYPGGLIQAHLVYSENASVVYARLYHQNGKIAADGKYIDQQKDSIWNYYSYYGGQLTMKEDYKLGLREGESIKLYNNGGISERIVFQQDKRSGLWEQFYQNGSPRLKGFYLNDEREGEFISWTSDGKLSIKGNYKNGLMDGKWTYYDEKGEPEIVVEYEKGAMLPNKDIEKRQDEFSKRVQESIGNYSEPELPF